MEREAIESIHFQRMQQYPNIQECCYSEAAKACIQVLDTNILNTSLLLQNTEEMGRGSAYLRKPVTREEGGALGADFTKVYATRSSTTSSEITPENKCDHIHLLASLQ
jgi:hypothetical protein